MKPEISVVIPAYNEEKLLANCLKCLKNQNFKKSVEIIVVDNNSTDNTAKIAKSFGVKVIKEKRLGVIFAKQAGLLAAKGRIVAVTDADCEPSKSWLSKIYTDLGKLGVVGVSGPVENIGGAKWHDIYLRISFWFLGKSASLFGSTSYIMGGNTAFLRKEIVGLGGYDVRLLSCGDELGLLETMRKCGKVMFDKGLVNHTSPRRAIKGPATFFIDLILYILRYYNTKYLGIKKFNYEWEAVR